MLKYFKNNKIISYIIASENQIFPRLIKPQLLKMGQEICLSRLKLELEHVGNPPSSNFVKVSAIRGN